jgi:hypothetical protein
MPGARLAGAVRERLLGIAPARVQDAQAATKIN